MTTRLRCLLAAVPLVVLTACSSGSGGSSDVSGTVVAQGPASMQTATVVGNDKLKFSPNTVTAHVGTLVLTMDNSGGVAHNLVFDDASLGMTPTVPGHQSRSVTVTFTKPGTYGFVCTFHNGMTGQVVVQP